MTTHYLTKEEINAFVDKLSASDFIDEPFTTDVSPKGKSIFISCGGLEIDVVQATASSSGEVWYWFRVENNFGSTESVEYDYLDTDFRKDLKETITKF